MPEKILIVDDEPMLVSLLSDYLSDLGYFTCTAADGKEALDKLRFSPDLILLDINMPGMNGLELCRTIRDEVSCPILFLTSRASEQDRINGLLLGGDDYITKPFSLPETAARIAAHLRREARSRNSSRLLASRELLVNLSNRTVHYKGEKIDFSRREFDIIEFLITHTGQVFDRAETILYSVCPDHIFTGCGSLCFCDLELSFSAELSSPRL